jgi:hypothetical protein
MPFQRGQPRPSNAGRRAGTPNRASSDFREKVLRFGLSPVDFLCQTFRDPEQPMHLRIDAAKSIIPYIYPKLSNVDINSREGQPLVVQVVRFSADAPVEPNKRLGHAPIIEMTAADAATEAVEAVAMVAIEATSDGEEEC